MARSAMANLLTRLRALVNDTGATQTWTDNQLQEFLDARREVVRYLPLTGEATYSSAGAGPTYYIWHADCGDWEEDTVLSSATFATISPSTSDYVTGRWTFTTEPSYPVYLTGQTYDLCATAADVLRAWAGKVVLEYDFGSNDQRFSRSQQQQMLLALAREHDKRRRLKPAMLLRDDIAAVDSLSYDRVLRQ